MHLIKKIALIVMVVFYFVAGVNHFVMPKVYDSMMPPYFPVKNVLNAVVGILEIVLAIGLIFPNSRRKSAIAIIALLICFIPVHLYMLQESPMPFAGTILTPTGAWIRLAVHPLLMAWAWWFARK